MSIRSKRARVVLGALSCGIACVAFTAAPALAGGPNSDSSETSGSEGSSTRQRARLWVPTHQSQAHKAARKMLVRTADLEDSAVRVLFVLQVSNSASNSTSGEKDVSRKRGRGGSDVENGPLHDNESSLKRAALTDDLDDEMNTDE